jgi:hypothetical protein
MESYSDYGSSVANNAKRGIELNEKNGNKCATQVGKVRAQQLAQNQPISLETIKRMYSFLSRAEVYYDESKNPHSCTAEPIVLAAESLDDLKKDLKLMQKAFEKPVLEMFYFDNLEKNQDLDD